jgi:hypothetical protein
VVPDFWAGIRRFPTPRLLLLASHAALPLWIHQNCTPRYWSHQFIYFQIIQLNINYSENRYSTVFASNNSLLHNAIFIPPRKKDERVKPENLFTKWCCFSRRNKASLTSQNGFLHALTLSTRNILCVLCTMCINWRHTSDSVCLSVCLYVSTRVLLVGFG